MKTRSSSSATTDPVPLLQFPTGKLLPDLTIVTQPRSPADYSNGGVNTYFIEPGTSRKFKSLESVYKNLTGEVDDRRLTRARPSRTRVYEGSKTKQDHRTVEYSSKGFRLPKGWTVLEFPRRNTNQIDKYYVEPKTRKRFRSLVSVERYLKDSENRANQQLMCLKYRRGFSKDFKLPDGWILEEKPRRNSKQIDKSYIEPGTGIKFRSMAAVERYLIATGSMVHSEQLSLLSKGNDTGFQTEFINPTPPEKVKWVLTGPEGNMFSANMNGSDVSSSVKQMWSDAFLSLIQDHS